VGPGLIGLLNSRRGGEEVDPPPGEPTGRFARSSTRNHKSQLIVERRGPPPRNNGPRTAAPADWRRAGAAGVTPKQQGGLKRRSAVKTGYTAVCSCLPNMLWRPYLSSMRMAYELRLAIAGKQVHPDRTGSMK